MDTVESLTRAALVEFIEECAKGIEEGDIAGVAVLWIEMAPQALKSGVVLPLQASIAKAARGQCQYDAHGWASFLRGFALGIN